MLLVVVAAAIAMPAQAQEVMTDRARACSGLPLEEAADFALAHEIEAWGWQVMVRRGELFVCDPSCVAWGRVDMLVSQRRGEHGELRVVPSDRPSVVETWALIDGSVVVRSRQPRSVLDRRRRTDEDAPAPERTLASWAPRRAAELDRLAFDGASRFGEARIASVRTPAGLAGIAMDTSGNQISAVAFVRRGSETFRSCLVREEIGGGIALEDALEARPLGEDLGAVFLRVRIGRQGYAYDMGAWTELWALVPAPHHRLSLSYVPIADWLGSSDLETGETQWQGWVAPLRTVGPLTLRLGRREIWTRDRNRRPIRVRASETGAPVLLQLDEHGFVPRAEAQPLDE
jgi:hypothetical protein